MITFVYYEVEVPTSLQTIYMFDKDIMQQRLKKKKKDCKFLEETQIFIFQEIKGIIVFDRSF